MLADELEELPSLLRGEGSWQNHEELTTDS